MSAMNSDSSNTAERKDKHLRICLEEDVDFVGISNGFEAYRFDHDALPEINKNDIQTQTHFLGKELSIPLMVGAMTGGTAQAGEINRILAQAAEQTGVAFALGSQRRMLESAEALSSYDMRQYAPNTLILGNLGAVQLNYGVTAEQISELMAQTAVDGINFHLNPLQEAIQPEGDTNFSGLLDRLKETIPLLPGPVVLKEVGAGISATTARKIAQLPIAALEIAGVGGTSWAKIESFRATDMIQSETGEQLASWGIPTAESLITCKKELPDLPLVCSGGMRTGLEMAKALALGAHMVAMAMPFLHAAQDGVDSVVATIEQIREELKTVMFVTGSDSIKALREQAVIRRTK
jgi:isopentenyl-diphosphate delta-isomerase